MKEIHSIGQSIFICDKYFKAFLKKELKKYNINRAEAMALMMLITNNSLTELHYDKGVLSRTIQSLEEKGYVTKSASTSDGRANDLNVTDSAKSVGHEIDNIIKKWNDNICEGVDEELLRNYFDILVHNAKKLADE